MLASIVWDYPAMDLDDVITRYHRALDEFSRGDPDALKALYAEAEDVSSGQPIRSCTARAAGDRRSTGVRVGTDARRQGHQL